MKEMPTLQEDPYELDDDFIELDDYPPKPVFDEPSVEFLIAFISRACKDYIELDPSKHSKSSEFSDGFTEFDEWKTAADFLFGNEPVMYSWDITFSDLCAILDIDEESFLTRISKKRVLLEEEKRDEASCNIG